MTPVERTFMVRLKTFYADTPRAKSSSSKSMHVNHRFHEHVIIIGPEARKNALLTYDRDDCLCTSFQARRRLVPEFLTLCPHHSRYFAKASTKVQHSYTRPIHCRAESGCAHRPTALREAVTV